MCFIKSGNTEGIWSTLGSLNRYKYVLEERGTENNIILPKRMWPFSRGLVDVCSCISAFFIAVTKCLRLSTLQRVLFSSLLWRLKAQDRTHYSSSGACVERITGRDKKREAGERTMLLFNNPVSWDPTRTP